MSIQTKYQITRVAVYVCLAVALFGVYNVYTTLQADGFWGIGLLFTGCGLGFVMSLASLYFKAHLATLGDPRQLAIETLVRLRKRER